MSNVTDERLQDLVCLVNNRLREFGPDTFPLLSWGVVRLMLGAVREWDEAQDVQVVHGPTGAAIASEGIVRLGGDGYGSFLNDGERIKFRITPSDDEANADRYYRGFNDGVEFVQSGEWQAARDRAGELAMTTPELPDTYPDGAPRARLDADDLDRQWERDCEEEAIALEAQAIEEDRLYKEAVEELVGSETVAEFLGNDQPKDAAGMPAPFKPVGPGRVPDPDVARENVAMMLANGSGGALVQAIAKPRTLEEVDADRKRDYKREYELRAKRKSPSKHDRSSHQAVGRNGNVLPTLDEVIAEIKRQAMAGVAPSMSQFNDARPANWATVNSQMQRFDMTWHQLIERAGLKPNRRSE